MFGCLFSCSFNLYWVRECVRARTEDKESAIASNRAGARSFSLLSLSLSVEGKKKEKEDRRRFAFLWLSLSLSLFLFSIERVSNGERERERAMKEGGSQWWLITDSVSLSLFSLLWNIIFCGSFSQERTRSVAAREVFVQNYIFIQSVITSVWHFFACFLHVLTSDWQSANRENSIRRELHHTKKARVCWTGQCVGLLDSRTQHCGLTADQIGPRWDAGSSFAHKSQEPRERTVRVITVLCKRNTCIYAVGENLYSHAHCSVKYRTAFLVPAPQTSTKSQPSLSWPRIKGLKKQD